MRSMKTRLAAGVTVAALAGVVAAPAAFAQEEEIKVGEGGVEITDTFSVDESIFQNSGASVSFGDENENFQSVSNSQNAVIDIDGDENEVEVEQDLEQNGFSPEVSTESEQSVAQSATVSS